MHLLLAAFLGAGVLASTEPGSRLCFVSGECRDHACGREVVPAAEARRFVMERGDEYIIGVLPPKETTVACSADSSIELQVTPPKPSRADSLAITITDESSTWSIDVSERELAKPIAIWLPRGTYTLVAEMPHASPFKTAVRVAGPRRKLSAVLKPLAVLTGNVVARESGRGIGGAVVSVGDEVVAIADATGRYSFEADPEAWPSSVSATAAGYASSTVLVPPARLGTTLEVIRLVQGGNVLVELQQHAPGTVSTVTLQELKNGGRAVGRTLTTLPVANDANAVSLRFGPVEAGEYLVLAQGKEAWERRGERVSVNTGEDARVELRITPFRLMVRTALRDQALGNARVDITNKDAHWDARLETDASGETAVELWQGGNFNATLAASGMTPHLERRWVKDGRDTDWLLTPPERELVGRVVDATTGKPVPNAGVALEMKSDEGFSMSVQATADANGGFRFSPVAYGTHQLKAAARGYAITEMGYSFREPEQTRELTIRLDPGTLVRLKVLDSRGQPVGGALVMEFRGLAQVNRVTTDPTGTTALVCADGDVRDLYIVPRDGSFGLMTLQCGVEEASVRIAEGSSRIVLVAETEARTAIPGVSVAVRYNGRVLPFEVLQAIAATQGAHLAAGPDGRIVLPHMPPGLYEFWPAGSMAELRTLAAGLGDDAPLRLVAAPGQNEATMTFARVR